MIQVVGHAMSDYVKKFTAADEFYFKEGCFIIEMSNDPDDADVSVAQARLETGQQTKWHWLNDTFERYVILQGEGLVEVGAEGVCRGHRANPSTDPAADKKHRHRRLEVPGNLLTEIQPPQLP